MRPESRFAVGADRVKGSTQSGVLDCSHPRSGIRVFVGGGGIQRWAARGWSDLGIAIQLSIA
jgi:hypothetical protein